MNVDETTIANAALRIIGAAGIVNLSDASDRSLEATQCRFFYPLVRQAVFESYPWKCVSKQVELTTTTDEPTFGYNYAFALPADFVRPVCLDNPRRVYKVLDGRTLYCNISPVEIEYVYLCSDCTKYTGSLVRCLYLNLAYELAFAITQKPEIAAEIEKHLEKVFLPVARMADSAMQGHLEQQSNTLTDVFGVTQSGRFADPGDFEDRF